MLIFTTKTNYPIHCFDCQQQVKVIRQRLLKSGLQVQSVLNMQFEVPLTSSRKKSDIVFYYAFSYLKRFNHFSIAVEILKALAFIILIPINLIVLQYAFSTLFVSFIINLISSLIGVLYYSMVAILIYGSVMTYLNIADQANHVVLNQTVYDFSCLQHCVSPVVYIAGQQINEQDLDQAGRKVHQNIAKSMIKAIIKSRYQWLRNIENLYSILSFASMVYAIFVLAYIQMVPIDTCLLSLYVVVVGITQIQIIIVCVAIILSPLICLGLAIYCCFCAKNKEGNNFIDLQVKEAKQSDIVNAGGDCSICFMSMVPKEKIYILPCSEKHVFHSDCLRHWAKVKNTCPICRGVIPMTSAERGSLPPEQAQRMAQ